MKHELIVTAYYGPWDLDLDAVASAKKNVKELQVQLRKWSAQVKISTKAEEDFWKAVTSRFPCVCNWEEDDHTNFLKLDLDSLFLEIEATWKGTYQDTETFELGSGRKIAVIGTSCCDEAPASTGWITMSWVDLLGLDSRLGIDCLE